MHKRGPLIVLIGILSLSLTGCLGSVWTGVNTVYDRHHLYKKMDDFHLFVAFNDKLALHKTFAKPNCVLDLAVFNGDILIAGHLTNSELMEELNRRLAELKGYRRLFNEVVLSEAPSSSIQDSWITTKIRSRIIADSSIDPNAFKVITSDKIVYLLGDVQPDQADKLIKIARNTQGVVKVVKLLKYYTYQ